MAGLLEIRPIYLFLLLAASASLNLMWDQDASAQGPNPAQSIDGCEELSEDRSAYGACILELLSSENSAVETRNATTTAGPTPERLAGVQAITKPATADRGDDEYIYGYRLWEAGYYPEAQQQLAMLVEEYPDHWRTTYGRNLLGRAFMDAGDPRRAATHFVENYQSDKQAARAPDSLLLLAESMVQLGDMARACIALSEFREAYPSMVTGRLQAEFLVIGAQIDGCSYDNGFGVPSIASGAARRRETSTEQNNGRYRAPQQQPQRASSHQQTCARYGFESGSNEFANCVMQLDQAAQLAQTQERQYQLQLQQYQQQLAAYQAQQQELERRRRREETAAFLRGAANGVNSGCRGSLDCFAVGAATELGGVTLPPPPQQPQRPPVQQNYTIRSADGSMVNCTFISGVNYMQCR